MNRTVVVMFAGIGMFWLGYFGRGYDEQFIEKNMPISVPTEIEIWQPTPPEQITIKPITLIPHHIMQDGEKVYECEGDMSTPGWKIVLIKDGRRMAIMAR